MSRKCKCGCKFKQSRKKQKNRDNEQGVRTRVIIFCPDCDINCVYEIYDWESEYENEQFRLPAYDSLRKLAEETDE